MAARDRYALVEDEGQVGWIGGAQRVDHGTKGVAIHMVLHHVLTTLGSMIQLVHLVTVVIHRVFLKLARRCLCTSMHHFFCCGILADCRSSIMLIFSKLIQTPMFEKWFLNTANFFFGP